MDYGWLTTMMQILQSCISQSIISYRKKKVIEKNKNKKFKHFKNIYTNQLIANLELHQSLLEVLFSNSKYLYSDLHV